MASTLQQDFQAVENWALNLFATIKADVEIAEQDIIQVFGFLQTYAGQIASGLTGVLSIVAAAGVGIPAPILTAAAAVAAASQTINAAVAAQQAAQAAGASAGNQTVTLLATAYQGLKTAQANLAQGQSTVAAPAAPATTAAP